jgi:5-histidylcysteine sulfoxide synthase/putative 4-mercaptohistidine N1-methyltranferase
MLFLWRQIGVSAKGELHSLPILDLRNVSATKAQDYFDNSWTIYESLFAGFHGEEGFYRPPPHGLRHPQIFYYGHSACLYVNKLRVAGLLKGPVNEEFERDFEVGVDEMLWDDMHKNDKIWARVGEVHEYRQQVYEVVSNVIQQHCHGQPITQRDPLWALMMCFEHERIHLETSSVLLRETPLHLLQTPDHWAPTYPHAADTPTSYPTSGHDYPNENRMIAVAGKKVTLGKPTTFPTFGWDNEYGHRTVNVPDFAASEFMITNAEFWDFVNDGGYRNPDYWSADSWRWRTHRNLKAPYFWQPAGPQGSHEYRLRTIFDVISMPWDWPVDVTYYEAKAYCAWKRQQDGIDYRLLTEAEHQCLRGDQLEQARADPLHDPIMTNKQGTANVNLAFSSQNPVDAYLPSPTGHYDVTGNAWEWTEDHFNPLDSFKIHDYYDDFSTPCFDGKHSLIVGGSFMSTGDEASVFARFHFRPHFLQHSGFRLVASNEAAPATHLYDHFHGQAAARDLSASLVEASASRSDKAPLDEPTPEPANNVYESDASLHMYLGLHYPESGKTEGIPPFVPHENGPYHGLSFPQRVVNLLTKLQTKNHGKALDIGCAVGGASFELAKTFRSVDAFDFSESFVKAAKLMQDTPESVTFRVPLEAEISAMVQAVHGNDMTKEVLSKVNFFQGDACKMDSDDRVGTYDGVVMANLLCRLPDPVSCLDSLPGIVNKDGIVVLVTPFSWLPEFTERRNWLGGYDNVYSKDTLKALMEERGFEKIHEEQMPLIIREHQRKMQYIISEATGWRKA